MNADRLATIVAAECREVQARVEQTRQSMHALSELARQDPARSREGTRVGAAADAATQPGPPAGA